MIRCVKIIEHDDSDDSRRLHFWCLHWSLAGAPRQSYAVVVRELWATGYTPVDADGLKMLGESQKISWRKSLFPVNFARGIPSCSTFWHRNDHIANLHDSEWIWVCNYSESVIYVYDMYIYVYIYIYIYTLIDAYVLSQNNSDLTIPI